MRIINKLINLIFIISIAITIMNGNKIAAIISFGLVTFNIGILLGKRM